MTTEDAILFLFFITVLCAGLGAAGWLLERMEQ